MTESLVTARRGFLTGALGLGAGAVAASVLPFHARAAWATQTPVYPAITAGVKGYVSARKVPGMAVSIGMGTSPAAVISEGNLAFDNAAPITGDSLFRSYSMTKPVTGIAAMMLVEEGKLRLEQPIADFLPEFANMRVVTGPDTLESVPATSQITIRHLLTHTAGLGYTIVTKGPLLAEYMRLGLNPASVGRVPIPGFTAAPTPDAPEFCKRLATLPLMYQPGSVWSYSVSLDVLGHIIALVSGKAGLGAFLDERMFAPLGMTSSFFTVPESEKPRLTTNYASVFGSPFPIDHGRDSVFAEKPAFDFGGSGLVCSPSDYDRFLAMLAGDGMLDGKRIMAAETVQMATSDMLPQGAVTEGSFITGHRFGAGGRVGRGVADGSFGWSGAAGTIGWVDMKRRMRAGGWAQFFPSSTYPFQQELPQWLAADLAQMRAAA